MSVKGFTIKGDDVIVKNLSALPAKARAGAMRGLLVGGERVLQVSNTQVPHETGDLQRSGGVSQDGLTTAVYYDTDYAVPQHENLDMQHDAGRNAKFLENAVNQEADTVAAILAQAISEELAT